MQGHAKAIHGIAADVAWVLHGPVRTVLIVGCLPVPAAAIKPAKDRISVLRVRFLALPCSQTCDSVTFGVETTQVLQKFGTSTVDEVCAHVSEQAAALGCLLSSMSRAALLVGSAHAFFNVIVEPDRHCSVPHHGAIATGELIAALRCWQTLLRPLVHRHADVSTEAHTSATGALCVTPKGVVVAVAVPRMEAMAQVVCIEPVAAQQGVGDAEPHCRVIRPLSRPEAEGVVGAFVPDCIVAHPLQLADAVPNRGELQRCAKSVSDDIAKHAAKTPVQRLQCCVLFAAIALHAAQPLHHVTCCLHPVWQLGAKN
mmetsp:Transcript_74216/g.172144  ORF Transcript_74216/g.172144 Transcript_74216/m.172144 type:complete len:313 (+) Transcript_74216:484-1422(+)